MSCVRERDDHLLAHRLIRAAAASSRRKTGSVGDLLPPQIMNCFYALRLPAAASRLATLCLGRGDGLCPWGVAGYMTCTQ